MPGFEEDLFSAGERAPTARSGDCGHSLLVLAALLRGTWSALEALGVVALAGGDVPRTVARVALRERGGLSSPLCAARDAHHRPSRNRCFSESKTGLFLPNVQACSWVVMRSCRKCRPQTLHFSRWTWTAANSGSMSVGGDFARGEAFWATVCPAIIRGLPHEVDDSRPACCSGLGSPNEVAAVEGVSIRGVVGPS